MRIHLTLYIFSLFAILNGYIANKCCDQTNSATSSNDCACSDQTGGVGICICKTSPNIRQRWLCKKDSNGDSVYTLNTFKK